MLVGHQSRSFSVHPRGHFLSGSLQTPMLAPPGLFWPPSPLSGPSLPPTCPKISVKIASDSPISGQDGANLAQHSTKMSQHGLQKHPRDLEKHVKVLHCLRFLGFRYFGKLAPKIHPKAPQSQPRGTKEWRRPFRNRVQRAPRPGSSAIFVGSFVRQAPGAIFYYFVFCAQHAS